jgi:hypothetical protein
VKNNGSFHFGIFPHHFVLKFKAFEPTPSNKRSWKDYTGEFDWISPEQVCSNFFVDI